MAIRDVVKHMVNLGRSSTAPETAAIEITPGITLAIYLYAVGLTEVLKDNPKALQRAKVFVDKAWGQLDTTGLRKAGFNTKLLAKVSDWPTLVAHVKHFRDTIKKSYTNNPAVSAEEVRVVSFAGMFFQHPTKPNYVKRMMVNVTSLGPAYAASFSKVIHGKMNHDTGANIQEQLAALVKALTGKSGTLIPSKQVAEFKLSRDPSVVEKAKQYVRMRSDMRKQMLIDFATYVDQHEGKPVQVADANEFLYDRGYDEPLFPELPSTAPLFVGVDGGKATFYTADGRRLTAGIPANATNVIFMKTYNKTDGTGGYLSYRTPEAVGETPTKLYTADHKNQASTKKFGQAAKVLDNLAVYVAKWQKDLGSHDSYKFMASTAAILIYLTGMRVGSTVRSRAVSGKQSTGAVTLKVSNVKLVGSKLSLSYIGKKGVKQNHVLTLGPETPKGFKAAITELLTGKAPSEYLFSVETDKGTLLRLPYSRFNAYLKATGFPAGIHKIRHARGTSLMLEKMTTTKFKMPTAASTLAKKQKVAEDFIKDKVLTPVANLLGHKKASGEALWSTSITNYCDPAPVAKWFLDQGLRVPKWVPRKLTD